MTTLSSRWLARILAPLTIIGGVTGTSIALAGAASAANTSNPVICPATNPDTGFTDPTCGPFYFSGSSGAGGNLRYGDVTGAAHSQWGAPLWSGTFYEDSRENVFRSGVDAAAPYVQTSTTVYSSSIFGFHGCAEAFAYDGSHNVVYDSGVQRIGVDGGNSYKWTYGAYLSAATANSIVSIGIAQWQC